ncbi:MAG: GcrA family cell cycle regulator [Pseudomonadota bacterium]
MSGWTEERIQLLTGWVADGLSYSTIANLFADRGFVISRNAALGKAHRLGLSSVVPAGSRPRKAEFGEAKTPKPPRAVAPRGAAPSVTKAAPPRAPARESAPVRIVAAKPVLLWLIPAGGCHFPVSGEGAQTLFCADAAQDGQPYCPHHHQVTHQPVTGPARIFRDASIVRTKRADAQADLVDEIGEAA